MSSPYGHPAVYFRREPAPPYSGGRGCQASSRYLSLRSAADFATDEESRNNAKATMTNPRAHAQESKIATPHRIRAKLKRFFGPWGMFVRGFIKHPVMVGWVVPSPPRLIRPLRPPVDLQNTKLVVE